METIGGFAPIADSRPTTPPPSTNPTADEGDSTATPKQPTPAAAAAPAPSAAAQPTLDQELASVMAGIGSFWGKVRKQSVVAYQTAEKQIAADLSPLVSKARAQAAQLSESTKAELARLQEQSQLANGNSGLNVMIGADGTPVIVDAVPAQSPRVDKGKGVDPAERGDGSSSSSSSSLPTEHATPAAAASAFLSSLQTSFNSNPNLARLQSSLTTAQAQLQTNLATVQTNLSASAANLPAQLQQLTHLDPSAAEAYLSKGESWLAEFSSEVQRLAKDAVRVVPPGGDDERSRKREERLRRAEEVAVGRTDVLVRELRSNAELLRVDPARPPASSTPAAASDAATAEGEEAKVATTTTPAEDTREAFAKFLQSVEDAGGFEGDAWTARVAKESDEKLLRTRDSLVGTGEGKMSREAFWSRYFFRKEAIEEEERRRKGVLLQGAGTGEDEDFSWDMEEEDDEDTPLEQPSSLSNSTPTLVPTPSSALPTSSAPTTAPTSPDSKTKSPRASSDGASSYDVVGEQSGTPSEVDPSSHGRAGSEEGEVAVEPKRSFAQTRKEEGSDGEDSDWE